MDGPKTVAVFCQQCQQFIVVVPVRRLDRVYVPLCTKCVPEQQPKEEENASGA